MTFRFPVVKGHTLSPVEAESIDFDQTRNWFIEGDNLPVLELLATRIEGRVKMIYIDPPYNTGKQFVYSDQFGDEEATQGSWLGMMRPRLELAQRMLQDDGVLFVSIDDHELSRLRILTDSIFGRRNHITTFVWRRSGAGGLRGMFPVTVHEYVLCYARKKTAHTKVWRVPYSPQSESAFSKQDNKGRYKEQALYLSRLRTSESQSYPIQLPDGSWASPPGKGGAWRFVEQTFERERVEGRIVFKKSKKSPLRLKDGRAAAFNIYTKQYVDPRGSNPSSILPEETIGRTRSAKSELRRLLHADVFDYAKPTSLVEYLCRMIHVEEDEIVLDFFAGSGSTGHAVIALNQMDGKNRRFILVQNAEQTGINSRAREHGYDFISQICKERMRRVLQIAKVDSKEKDDNLDLGMRVYELRKCETHKEEIALEIVPE